MDDLTNEEVMILLERQLNPYSHSYTCTCGLSLYPISQGWVCSACGFFRKYGIGELELVGRNENK